MTPETQAEGREEPVWKVTSVKKRPLRLEVEAWILHRDNLNLGMPGLGVIVDPLADDMGAEGVADYLNALEARIRDFIAAFEAAGHLIDGPKGAAVVLADLERRNAVLEAKAGLADEVRHTWDLYAHAYWRARFDALLTPDAGKEASE